MIALRAALAAAPHSKTPAAQRAAAVAAVVAGAEAQLEAGVGAEGEPLLAGGVPLDRRRQGVSLSHL